jgi:Protein of unknown function (DUF3168)
MSIQSSIITALEGVVGDEVYEEAAPQDIKLPMVIYVRKSRDPISTLLGATGDVNSEIIFECYAYTKAEALTVAEAVRAAIVAARSSFLGGTGLLPTQYELTVTTEAYTPDVMEYMEPVAYGFWHT